MNNKAEKFNYTLDALRKGDKVAFSSLVEETSESIYRLALRMLNDTNDAEDVLQETFIKAYKNLPGFEGRSKVSTWLYRIAVNEALMMIRKRKDNIVSIDEEIEMDNGDLIPKQIVDWCCLPEEELMNTETKKHISEAMQALSPSNLAVFTLRDISDLSTAETASILNISESAVKTRLLRARLGMRENLTKYYSTRMVTK
ncbi:MAG: sigma-70 family RNA polymerase sigma factor [Anaerolineaceae bacterium]|nr:sigma-70 family RNA polymerase sigma factor [Anaerolineaceae bacterium]